MKNIKGFAIANDGDMKRIAITYDEITAKGNVENANVKANRIITDEAIIAAVEIITEYAKNVVEE